MLVSTRIRVKLPRREKDPTTTELRTRCRSEGMGFGQYRGKALASKTGMAGLGRRLPATSRGLKTAKTERAAFHPRRVFLIRDPSLSPAAPGFFPPAPDSRKPSPLFFLALPSHSNLFPGKGVV